MAFQGTDLHSSGQADISDLSPDCQQLRGTRFLFMGMQTEFERSYKAIGFVHITIVSFPPQLTPQA